MTWLSLFIFAAFLAHLSKWKKGLEADHDNELVKVHAPIVPHLCVDLWGYTLNQGSTSSPFSTVILIRDEKYLDLWFEFGSDCS